ncbi:MAG: ATP-dependent endonuclease [Herminiimonas sp.]|nr:ATP-dependent endonuclease [Herminiimonas sp.]
MTVGLIERFVAAGGQYITWRPGLALKDELFRSSSNDAVHALLNKADEMVGRELIAEHIKSKSNGQVTLDAIEAEWLNGGYTPASRALLGLAARNNKNGWFKSVTGFQEIAKDVVRPHLANAEPGFIGITNQLWGWTSAPA